MVAGLGEHSEVAFGRSVIAYAIRRSHRRGTVSIAVEPSGDVLVTAPESTGVARLDRVVRDKGAWVLRHVRKRLGGMVALPREFVSGETFRYWGRGYRLKVASVAGTGVVVALRGGRLEARVGRGVGASLRRRAIRDAVVAWYRGRAGERLPKVVDNWARRLGVEPKQVLLREPTKRWGSCDAHGTLRLNWRIVQAGLRAAEYVVAHELVHLAHPHHSAAFWATLGRAMPDYELRQEELRWAGREMLW